MRSTNPFFNRYVNYHEMACVDKKRFTEPCNDTNECAGSQILSCIDNKCNHLLWFIKKNTINIELFF